MPRLFLTLYDLSSLIQLLEEAEKRFSNAGMSAFYNDLLLKLKKAKKRKRIYK